MIMNPPQVERKARQRWDVGCETDFFAGRFLRDRSICDPIYSFGATFALSPRVRGESRREGTLFRHLKNFVSHP